MWKSCGSIALAMFLVAAFQTRALAVCGDVTGEGELTSSDALAVLRAAVGQETTLICSCSDDSVCATDGSDDACDALSINACDDCCDQSDSCQSACTAADFAFCEIDNLNEQCAEEINDAGCGPVCCPGGF